MSKALENMTREELIAENSKLQFELKQLKRAIFGKKSERFVPVAHGEGQMELPFNVEEKPIEKEPCTEEITYTRKKNSKKKHPGRFPLPNHLPVKEIVIEPKEDTSGLKCIGKEITDKLELVPAKLFILRYIRPKYIKPEDEKNLTSKGIIAELPSFPIEKGIAGAGLLAQIAVDKYVDHLPIHRQIQRYKREDVHIPANTINGWQDRIAELITPLFEKQKQLVLGQGYLQVDESPIKVLDKQKKDGTHQGYYWVYNSPLQDALIFDYRKGRGREGPGEMLLDFKGYLQSDGYKVYDWFGKKREISVLNCWAHVRRYFEKAKDSDLKAAIHVLTEIQKLYMIERFAKNTKLTGYSGSFCASVFGVVCATDFGSNCAT
jgi:transposase